MCEPKDMVQRRDEDPPSVDPEPDKSDVDPEFVEANYKEGETDG
jgi:hypothetical protein